MKVNGCIACMVVLLLLHAPIHGWAQKKEPVPSNRVTSIAFIDDIRLRKEYLELVAARKKLHDEGAANRKTYDSTQRQITEQLHKSLQKDSLAGGKQKQKLNNNATASRSVMESQYLAAVKKRNEARIALMKTYEEKIKKTLQTVVIEGGFTEIKPVSDSAKFKGTNITNTVLQKLNQN